jgi:hypothetical protein
VDRPGFGDSVQIKETPETVESGFSGRSGSVYGESIPSSSGVGPVIGAEGEDLALSVYFEDTKEQEWFAPHLLEFLDHGAGQTLNLEGGPAFVRDDQGNWEEVGGETPAGRLLAPESPLPRVVDDRSGAIRRWVER